jgi:hypothetical protein
MRPPCRQVQELSRLTQGSRKTRSKRHRKPAAVDDDILSRDVASMHATEEGADLPELCGGTESLGRNFLARASLSVRFGNACALGDALEAAAQPCRVETAGQHVVDGDILRGDRARHTRYECGEAGPGSARQIKASDRHLHAGRSDVNDAAKAATCHSVDYSLRQLDGRDHIHGHTCNHGLSIELPKILERRPAIVVDEDVRGGAYFQQLGLAFGRRYVGEHRSDLNPKPGLDFIGGGIEQWAVTPVDDKRYSRLGQSQRAAFTQSLTRRADYGAASAYPQIHK